MDFMRSIYEMPGLLETLGQYSVFILLILLSVFLIGSHFLHPDDKE